MKKGRTGKGRILLLEDHMALASLRRDFLIGQGYEVTCSSTGEEASRLLESRSFHLLIADALLTADGQDTKKSGWDVAMIAKARGVPVILSSGWPVRLGAKELRNRGIDYLCPKPCSLHQLLGLIENAALRHVSPESGMPVLKTQYESRTRKSDH